MTSVAESAGPGLGVVGEGAGQIPEGVRLRLEGLRLLLGKLEDGGQGDEAAGWLLQAGNGEQGLRELGRIAFLAAVHVLIPLHPFGVPIAEFLAIDGPVQRGGVGGQQVGAEEAGVDDRGVDPERLDPLAGTAPRGGTRPSARCQLGQPQPTNDR